MRFVFAIRVFMRILLGRPVHDLVQVEPGALPATTLSTTPSFSPQTVPAPAQGPPEVQNASVRALSVLQSEGRVLDFVFEDIHDFSDAEVGAAVREIHRGCRRALEEHFQVRPVRPEAEDDAIIVPEGYDPTEIRLVGRVVGSPPFSGILKHRGWQSAARMSAGTDRLIIMPAEVELL